ncbi:hypothetical protein BF14_034360 [Streptomyces griseus]|nr:hypothetical protein BF14_034360 [Streptomyces griseus]
MLDPQNPQFPPPVPASRRSVLLLAAGFGLLAIAALAYVVIDRPELREPLVTIASIVGGFSAPVAIAWAVYQARSFR